MKASLLIILLFLNLGLFAQADTVAVKEGMQTLDKALLEKDTAALRTILHNDIAFGHSNGWIEDKNAVISDLVSGKLVYNKIETTNATAISVNENSIITRSSVGAAGTVNGKTFDLNMHVLQVWIKTKNGWQLLARQSAKQ
jgi:hypothetical protein